MVALFGSHPEAVRMFGLAERGHINLLLPAACIADAEAQLRAGPNGWAPILLTGGVLPLPLTESTAIEVGPWPGTLAARHAVHEARAMLAGVVTRDPGVYQGLPVPLLVI